ncbi:hypothetical protein N7492_006798 [Penicillium capsulatum]|uniref:Mid2 domain-containing protein n=1 Tax=Penicillium capsulatum TaxID=69766 RepID=A0A9W9I139_9EURO|nr:hypothetical protein N7492_006798 [Penicillium capsulatum]KAJ6116632.1 hypothetical protein N7512_006357 [Penicillium capsulatum]
MPLSTMSLRAVGLLALPLLSSVWAIDFPSVAPTASSTVERPQPLAPQPTPGLSLRQLGILRRRDDYTTSSYWWSDQPQLCGWVGASLGSNNEITCASTATCRYHASNSNYPGLIGCCAGNSGTDCGFDTACYAATDVSKSPDITKTQDAFALFCTETNSGACVTFIYSDIDVTNFGCGSTSERIDAYTSAWDDNASGTIVSRWDQYLTPIADNEVSAYDSKFASSTNSQAAVKATNLASSSRSPHTTETASPASSSSHSATAQKGAIGGGVAGGVVGGILIALAAVYLLRRRSKNKAQAGPMTGPDAGGAYQSVPGNRPGYSPVEMQPAEMESSDPAHRMPEAQGSGPADRAFEMQGDNKAELETDQKGVTKDFVAELPADGKHEPTPSGRGD